MVPWKESVLLIVHIHIKNIVAIKMIVVHFSVPPVDF